MIRQLFIQALRQKIGAPYLWGGTGPEGYDCSGVICTCLNEAGYPIRRTNAAGLAELYRNNEVPKTGAIEGVLFFYGESNRVHHIMSVLTRWPNGHIILAGARGGDNTTNSINEAARLNAMVDIVESNYWNSKFLYALDPFLNEQTKEQL